MLARIGTFEANHAEVRQMAELFEVPVRKRM
jgi:hypothetical protein